MKLIFPLLLITMTSCKATLLLSSPPVAVIRDEPKITFPYPPAVQVEPLAPSVIVKEEPQILQPYPAPEPVVVVPEEPKVSFSHLPAVQVEPVATILEQPLSSSVIVKEEPQIIQPYPAPEPVVVVPEEPKVTFPYPPSVQVEPVATILEQPLTPSIIVKEESVVTVPELPSVPAIIVPEDTPSAPVEATPEAAVKVFNENTIPEAPAVVPQEPEPIAPAVVSVPETFIQPTVEAAPTPLEPVRISYAYVIPEATAQPAAVYPYPSGVIPDLSISGIAEPLAVIPAEPISYSYIIPNVPVQVPLQEPAVVHPNPALEPLVPETVVSEVRQPVVPTEPIKFSYQYTLPEHVYGSPLPPYPLLHSSSPLIPNFAGAQVVNASVQVASPENLRPTTPEVYVSKPAIISYKYNYEIPQVTGKVVEVPKLVVPQSTYGLPLDYLRSSEK